MGQMYGALYELNVEPDFVPAGEADLSRYRVLLVPPLYSASDAVLRQISDFVEKGGHVVMAFKSGFANEHSTVRWDLAPGPLRKAAGFHYQEFTNLAEPVGLTPDRWNVGDENRASVWHEFLIPGTAEVLATSEHQVWKYPVITRNGYGKGTLTYEAAVVTNALQREIIREAVARAGLPASDQKLPPAVKVRHGKNGRGKTLHLFFNFSDQEQSFAYAYAGGSDLLTNRAVHKGATLWLSPWDVAIVAEQ
jgi:beta-galactosidase